MRVTKYLHSCLLLEEGEKTILIDPGNYSYDAKIFPFTTLQKLDYIFITHEHMDHMHLPFVKELIATFPHVSIITNDQTKTTLASEGITAETVLPELVTMKIIPHENVFGIQVPQNSQFTFMNLLTHPGDSLHSTVSAKIFALPMQAPWGSLTEAVDLITKLKPEIVLPIHDWHWRDEARTAFYGWVKNYLTSQNISFIPLESGEAVELI